MLLPLGSVPELGSARARLLHSPGRAWRALGGSRLPGGEVWATGRPASLPGKPPLSPMLRASCRAGSSAPSTTAHSRPCRSRTEPEAPGLASAHLAARRSRGPPACLGRALWASEERPRRWDAEEGLRWRSCARPKSPILLPPRRVARRRAREWRHAAAQPALGAEPDEQRPQPPPISARVGKRPGGAPTSA